MADLLKKLFGKPKPEIITPTEYKKLKKETEEVNHTNKDATETSQETENPDQSIYSDDPEQTQDDDMEEDLSLLDDDDDLW